MNEAILLQLHAMSTLMMAGVIWFVQVVHYPMFSLLDGPSFTQYAHVHQQRTTLVVAPLMLIEILTATWLVTLPTLNGLWMTWLGISLLLVAWLSTAAIQMPCHSKLAESFNAATVRWLVVTNWIRTAAWSARGVLALALLSANL